MNNKNSESIAASSEADGKLAKRNSKEIFDSRSQALAHASAESVHRLGCRELTELQKLLRHGDRYGHWATPDDWVPFISGDAQRGIDLRMRIIHYLRPEHSALCERIESWPLNDASVASYHLVESAPDSKRLHHLIDGAVLALTRYLVLLRIGPAGFAGRGKGESLDPSTILRFASELLPRMLAACISSLFRSESSPRPTNDANFGYFEHLPRGFFDSLSSTAKRKSEGEVKRMFMLGAKGFWTDIPLLSGQLAPTTAVAGDATPKPAEEIVDPHLPLPDDYVATMGSRSLWLVQALGPNIIRVLEGFKSIWESTDDLELSPSAVKTQRFEKVTEYLASFQWRDGDGAIVAPPFPIYIWGDTALLVEEDEAELQSEDTDSVEAASWPPRLARDIFRLAAAVQLAHLFVVAMAMAGRRSEIITLRRSCIQYASNGSPFADGRTFKLVKSHDGVARDWVLPDVAVLCIEQQVRLIKLAESIGNITPDRSTRAAEASDEANWHLWGQSTHGSGDRSKRLINVNAALVRYAQTLGMDTKPSGQNLRSHRFRKTIARLVALALVQAPKILMDVFGHKSIEMTLYYILTDKDLAAEVERVARELRVMRATEVVEKMLDEEHNPGNAQPRGAYGGPAALAMQRAISAQKEGLHKMGAEWGVDSAMELAELLTLQGKAWLYVRPGVICTKFPGTESGPCNKSKGSPEPARCQSHCKHRLEEPFLREDVDGAIADCVAAYAEAERANEELARALWAGQIRAHLSRFEDIRLKWLTNPVVRKAVGQPEDEGVRA